MRKVLLSFMIGLVAGAMAWAAPLCAGPVYVTNPGFECSIGGLTFGGFSAVPATPGSPTQVSLVNASVVGSTVYMNFNPGLVSGQDIWFYFTVTGGVLGVDLSLSGTGALISEVVCSQPLLPNNNCPVDTELARIGNSTGMPVVNAYFPATQTVYIYKDILVQNIPGTPGELSSFTQSFHTPEPMTFVLIGTGLLGLGILGRRRASK